MCNNKQLRYLGLSLYLEHGNNLLALLLVLGSNSLRAQKTSFLGRVPMELNRSLRLEAIVDQTSESLKNSDCATAIVLVSPKKESGLRHLGGRISPAFVTYISARGCSKTGKPQVDRVLMSSNDNQFILQIGVRAFKTSNDGELVPL
jgi:hypothetical protein